MTKKLKVFDEKNHSVRLPVVNLYDLNEATQKVLAWFFSFPQQEIGLSKLATVVNISKTTANRVVTKLIDDGFLNKEEIGNVWRISCNHAHPYNFSQKICYNLNLIYKSAIIEKVHQLIKNPVVTILFGSYRKGDDTQKSDIDIAVEVLGHENLNITEIGIFQKFGYRKNVKVNLHIFSRGKIDLNLFSNIANGIILEGFLEVNP
jgi:predicted nucleotidyltransferase